MRREELAQRAISGVRGLTPSRGVSFGMGDDWSRTAKRDHTVHEREHGRHRNLQ